MKFDNKLISFQLKMESKKIKKLKFVQSEITN